MNESLDPYLMLIGSATYYLCDLSGSSSVLTKKIGGDCPNLNGEGLENLLLWILQAKLETYFDGSDGPYGEFIDGISKWIYEYFKNGIGVDNLINFAIKLRKAVYSYGTPRQLLFGDIIGAIIKKKIENSVWKALPLYSGLNHNKWFGALQKETSIKELWPAQHLLGKADVFKGKSAIVQMPTSAGKTKAIELILRSAFLAERVKLSIIVAPFRALCHEIKSSLTNAFFNEPINVDELSDVLQADFAVPRQLAFPIPAN